MSLSFTKYGSVRFERVPFEIRKLSNLEEAPRLPGRLGSYSLQILCFMVEK